MRAVLLLALAACTRAEPSLEAGPSAAASAPIATPGPPAVAWDAPGSWTALESTASAIRKATYRVPTAPGDTDETQLTVTTAGGTVDANVERWKAQFKYPDAKRSVLESRGLSLTIVEIHGALLEPAPAPGAPPERPRRALLGAIAPTSPELTFFKMVGPEKTVDAAKADFLRLVTSVRAK